MGLVKESPLSLTPTIIPQNWPIRGDAPSATGRQVGNQNATPETLELMACHIAWPGN